MATIKNDIRAYITANGPSTENALVEDVTSKGAYDDRVRHIIKRMTDNGKLIKSGDDYTIAP